MTSRLRPTLLTVKHTWQQDFGRNALSADLTHSIMLATRLQLDESNRLGEML